MDVNGTRFHLIKSKQDWHTCCQAVTSDTLAGVAWDPQRGALILSPVLSLFPRSPSDLPLSPSARRGAVVDSFGNWYWISQDRQNIYWRPSGSQKSVVYWDQRPAQPTKPPGDFAPTVPPPSAVELAGLAVTDDHYLVAGNVTGSGLILFDLHAGGPPVWLPFPDTVTFTPFDIAPAPGGGLWVLDSQHRTYWGLDRAFRFITEPGFINAGVQPTPDIFCSMDGESRLPSPPAIVSGFPLLETTRPISITGQADGSVLVLDSPPEAAFSSIYRYELSQHLTTFPLDLELEVVVQGQGRRRQSLALIGHDMACAPDGQTVTVIERDGNQAVTLWLSESPPGVEVSHDYLPLYTAGGRALVAGADGLYYDVVGNAPTNDSVVRWVKLQVVSRPYYARSAILYLGQSNAMTNLPESVGLVDMPLFDGKEQDCVWHRLLLDACIPTSAAIRVWSRAGNRPELLASLPFRAEPTLYLRGNGAELPTYNPYPEKETLPAGAGTWELLFQEAQGRYLQLKIELAGNGRVTPQIRAMRIYYPRFSYPRRFLPPIYVDESRPGPFLERLLANMEGTYSEIEGKMRDISQFFDPRTAPPEALDWLASWMGLLLDPLWSRLQQERQEYVPGSSRLPDRRRLFIRFARKLYERRGTTDGIRFALELLLEPCLEVMMERLQATAIGQDERTRAELISYSLAPPTPTTSATALEDLLYAWVLRRISQVRLVESFLIRRGQALVAGDPTAINSTPVDDAFSTYAHQFTVLIPMGLSPEEEAMVQRVVNLEKPAHTTFSLRRYWEGFRVGEARLGLDTTLDRTNRFVAMLLGRDYLSAGYIDADHPLNVSGRLVSDRDRLGNMPPL